MSIVTMVRVTLCGLTRDKTAVLDGLQQLGALHVVALSEPGPLTPDNPAMRRRAETAFRHVNQAPELLRPFGHRADFDADAVIGDIMDNRQRLREVSDRRDEVEERIEWLEPWGDFTLPEPSRIGGQRLWFYALPLKQRKVLDALVLPWEVVGRTPTSLHVVVISPSEPPPDLLPVARTPVDGTRLSELRLELDDLEIAVERAERERADLSRWRLLLGIGLAAAQDRDELREVAHQTLDTEEVFAIQGWAPGAATPDLQEFAAARGLALVTQRPGPRDNPPTLLEARDERVAAGSHLTRFFRNPAYRSWDPSLVVLVSFCIFFAMIVADAGYAALFAILTAALWRRLGRSTTGRRARGLLAGLSVASLGYGILVGSYFGISPPSDSLGGRLWVLDLNSLQTMMVVTVAVGALHIIIALAVTARLHRGTPRALAALGWIGVVAAGMVIWVGGAQVRTVGIAALAAGLVAVFWGSGSARPVERPLDRLLRIGDGIVALTQVTKLFGDVLSYLRLFALGLATASLAATFNLLAGQVEAAVPGLGILLAGLVLLLGHTINLAIAVMSGVVHGLRLNYVEFFGWGLTEEGYPFRAFARRESPA